MFKYYFTSIFKKLKITAVIFFTYFSYLNAQTDLESHIPDFVLETHKIEIPGYPHAFNPSIIQWHEKLLMSFRDITDPQNVSSVHSSAHSYVHLVWLDNDFNPQGKVYKALINKDNDDLFPISHSEDARLISVGNDEHLYLIYSDNKEEVIRDGGFRMFVAELDFDGDEFNVIHNECLADFEGEHVDRREKNWVPFDYKGHLCLSYSPVPHKVFLPLLDGTGRCETFAVTHPSLVWEWGEIRGGTPALPIDENNYLAFFHSSIDFSSLQSNNENILHYFMGAYTFSSKPPFSINQISAEPIIGKNFYNGTIYDYYWKPVRVVFPCGFILSQDSIWVAYGRQDHEVWVVKIDKKELLDSLIPVSKKIIQEE